MITSFHQASAILAFKYATYKTPVQRHSAVSSQMYHQNRQWLPRPTHVPSQTQWWSNWRTHLSQSWQCFARGGCSTLQYEQVKLLMDVPGGYRSRTSFVQDVALLPEKLLPGRLPSMVMTMFPFLLEAGCFEVVEIFWNKAFLSFACLIASST